MSARIAPEPVGNINAGMSDYRPRTAPDPVAVAAASHAPRNNPDTTRETDAGVASTQTNAAVVPPPPEPEAPGTAYVRAVLSGALSPRPTSMQEVFLRTGTGWVPPESEYHLADKTI